jgi:riboflavin kinase
MAGKWDHLYENAQEVLKAPIYLSANVVHGFKRGSKELGIPTANLDMDVVNKMLRDKGNSEAELKTGIYYGWAKLGSSDAIHRTVISVGWNPFYKNEKKTLEAHLLSKMDDFYDDNLSVLMCGYLRDEANFTSLEDLIACINEDIVRANSELSSANNGLIKYGEDYSIWASAQ